MGLTVGDRVALERRIDTLYATFDERTRNNQELMKTLTARIEGFTKLVWFGLGLATASLIVQLIRVIVLLILRET